MLILSRVCADFHDSRGRRIFSVAPRDLLSFLEAPEEIREDPLFDLLLADGSLEAVRSVDRRRLLEADPVAGTTAEGRCAAPAAGKRAASGAPDSAVPAASGAEPFAADSPEDPGAFPPAPDGPEDSGSAAGKTGRSGKRSAGKAAEK